VPVRLKKTLIVIGYAIETVYEVPTAPGVDGVHVMREEITLHCAVETVLWIAFLAAWHGPVADARFTAAARAPTRAASVIAR
jgi:hypothetical protein